MLFGLLWIGGLSFTLFIGGVLSDYVLPRIPCVNRFLDSLGSDDRW
jgi:hypothetical protein